jgi:hypothetical protein
MDKRTYLEAQDITSLYTFIDKYIDMIHELSCEMNHIRFERRDHPTDGVLVALEAREGVLKTNVQDTFNGVRSNEDQRSTMLATMKLSDIVYKGLATELNSINMELDQKRIDVEHYTNRLQAATLAMRFKTAALRFLADE